MITIEGVAIGYVAGVGSCVVAALTGMRLRQQQPPTVEEAAALRRDMAAVLSESDALEDYQFGVGSIAHPLHSRPGGTHG